MFQNSLEEIMNRMEGCLGVLIMGTDGIPVEKNWHPEGRDANLDVAVAEFTTLIRSGQRTSDDIGLGRMRELIIACEGATFVMRILNADYFLVLILRPENNFGRARYELRRAELILENEFAV